MLRDTYDPDRGAAIEPGDHYDPIPGFPEICIGIFSQRIVEEAAQADGSILLKIKRQNNQYDVGTYLDD